MDAQNQPAPAENKALPPGSGATPIVVQPAGAPPPPPPTGTTREPAGAARQLLAAMKKNFHQKKRTKCQTCCEMILPILFMVGLVMAWAASAINRNPAVHFVDPAMNSTKAAFDVSEVSEHLCVVNATNVGLPLCPPGFDVVEQAPGTTIPPKDAGADDKPTLPTCWKSRQIPHVLCINDTSTSAVGMLLGASDYRRTAYVPTLDDDILFHWFTNGTFGENRNTGRQWYNLGRSQMAMGDIYFVPENPQTRDIANYLSANTRFFKYMFRGYFPTTDHANDHLKQVGNDGETLGVIDFSKPMTPTSLDVTLMWNRSTVPWTDESTDSFSSGYSVYNSLYLASGFLAFQDAIYQYYFDRVLNIALPSRVAVSPMPVDEYRDSEFLTAVGGVLPLVMALAFLFQVSQFVKRLVEEKELRIREGMMIMGMGTPAFYASWILTFFIQITLCMVVVGLLSGATLFEQSDITVVLVLFILFGCSIITFSTFLSSLFSKSRVAALMSPLMFVIATIPSISMPEGTAAGPLLLSALLPPSAFGIATQLLTNYEKTRGMGWGQVGSQGDEVNMGTAFAMLILDTILYLLLTFYLDAVMPSEWGTSRHPLFCFIEPYQWYKRKQQQELEQEDPLEMQANRSVTSLNTQLFEPHAGSHPSVRIRNLRKEFGTKVAVDDLNLNFYDSQINVLLGHNGAGKTTTVNMMTGMLPIDSGDVTVNGLSARHDLKTLRQSFGMCPQHNILWPNLTCKEHLEFYAGIKGYKGAELDENVRRMLHEVDLGAKADALSSELSGGQKRKLSVAIAFVGQPSVVFLDEPTAGMDVSARRHTWEVLRRLTPGRTIVLTTHFMDEADLLGHTVSIMGRGQLRCNGSPLFLKSRMGVGYTLTVSFSSNASTVELDPIIRRHVENGELLMCKGNEVQYRLPMNSVGSFPALFSELENGGRVPGMTGMGVTVTTLEEVFLKIAEADDIGAMVTGGDAAALQIGSPMKNDTEPLFEPEDTVRGAFSFSQQFTGLFKKRINSGKRDRRALCLQIIAPIVCLLFAMLMSLITIPPTPHLYLDTSMYKYDVMDIDVDNCPLGFSFEAKNRVTRPQPPNVWSYPFSEYLLKTHDTHTDERMVSYFCDDTQLRLTNPVTNIFTNRSAQHGAPQGVNEIRQAYARYATGNPAITFKIASHPLDLSERESKFYESITAFIVGIFVLIPFTLIPSNFVSFVVKEKETKAKHLQKVSGMHYAAYWLANFVWDYATYLIMVVLAILVFLIFSRDEYVGSGSAFGAILILLLLYGFSGVSSAYAVSFLFTDHASAQNIVMMANFICGFLLVLTAWILQAIEGTKSAAEVIVFFFRIVPSYCLGEGLINIATVGLMQTRDPDISVWDMDIIGWPLVYMALEIPFFLAMTIFLDHPERSKRQQMMFFKPDTIPNAIENEDPDVKAERDAVESGSRDGDVVVCKHLCKIYDADSGPKTAVRNMSFAVKKGEVFGFLGTNGAGKTTTSSILCGEFFPTHGHAKICGLDVVHQPQECAQRIGYCPQFDALHDLMTPTEHIELYAALRGINPAHIPKLTEKLLNAVHIKEYEHIPSRSLSGGNKRKLSFVIALIGGPPVVFLDEPSAGMDPVARRQLWGALTRVSEHSSIILTTHHLEEVEVLANRVGIMASGALQCIGSLQHLKEKFGKGYEMAMRLKDPSLMPQCQTHIEQSMPNAALTEARAQKLVYSLPPDARLSAVFEYLEANRAALGIEDYNVSQTSLEQVFLRISEADAARQEEERIRAEEVKRLKAQA